MTQGVMAFPTTRLLVFFLLGMENVLGLASGDYLTSVKKRNNINMDANAIAARLEEHDKVRSMA